MSDTFFSPLPTPEEMASWDATTINTHGVPQYALMENAARAAFDVARALPATGKAALVVMGSGNNGGDGAALARFLHEAGWRVLVIHTKPLAALSGAARDHALLAEKAGVPFFLTHDGSLPEVPANIRECTLAPDIVIDALLGTGFSHDLRPREERLVRFINALRKTATLLSLDIPSGLGGLDGLPHPDAVRAHHTVTFEAAKPGLAYPHASPYTGTVHVRAIGIPDAVKAGIPASFGVLAPCRAAWPTFAPDMHKGDAGRVVIVGGSAAYTGAPALAALGALRAGAGLVSIAAPEGVLDTIRAGFPEIMGIACGTGTTWTQNAIPPVLEAVRGLPAKASVVLGPGLGRDTATTELVAALLGLVERPSLVLDADGLFPLGAKDGARSPLLSLLRPGDCITPHPGEAAHLLGITAAEVQADRTKALRTLCGACEASVILKGAGTLIGQGASPIIIAPFAAPSLAVGGSGDVLSGVIAASIARFRTASEPDAAKTFRAACLGVYLHGRSGMLLYAKYPQRGALAREIADMIPFAYPES